MKRILSLVLAAVIGISTISGNAMVVKAESEKTVIALDPGHDATHSGATAEGLLEHELTQKIANYCRDELNKYGSIAVYMTRSSNECPYPDAVKSADCIRTRMQAAKFAGASYYVSIHLNAEEKGTTIKGAEVIYPNSNWKPELGQAGKALAELIQKQLVSLGITDRGIYYKDCSEGTLYPDGSASDAFTVHTAGKQNDIPSVIVENVFMTNETDRTTYLTTEEGLKKLGVANARAIAEMLGLRTGWTPVGNDWYYYYGSNVHTGWLKEDEIWYYLNENGIMQTGWIKVDGFWYYLNKSGEMQTGWQLINTAWYYLNEDGSMYTGWLEKDGIRYYLNEDGVMQTGWKVIDGVKYLFNEDGKIVEHAKAFIIDVSHWQGEIEWEKIAASDVDGVIVRCGHGDSNTEAGGNWKDKYFAYNIAELNRLGIPYGIYYYNTATTVEQAKVQAQNAIDEITAAGAVPTLPVYADIEEGAGTSDLIAITKVYMDAFVASGYKAGIYANANYWKNYLNDSSFDLYYKWIASYGKNIGVPSSSFDPVGGIKTYMMWQYTSTNQVDGITGNVDSNVLFDWHHKADDWYLVNGVWYHYQNGYLANSWRLINGKWYYFAGNGVMLTGWQYINDEWYYMNRDGAMETGWQLINEKWYYMNTDGVMLTDWVYEGGLWYYMNSDGAMQTDWQYVNGKWYYMDKSGKMLTDWQLVKGIWYYMNQNGAMETGWQFIRGKWYYMDHNGEMQTDWQYINGKWYYLNQNGAMETGWQQIRGTWYYMDATGAWVK